MAGWMLESFDGGIDFSIPVLLIGGLHRLLTDEGDAAGDSRGISTGEDGALTESSSSPQTSFVDDNSTSESNGGGGGRKGIGPYDSTGFIVWYCLLFLCCGLPFLCGVLSYTCYRIRKMRSRRRRGVAFGEEEEEEEDFVSTMFYAWERGRLGRNREELEIEREILRIEANVTAFAMKEQKRRKEALLKSWGDCRMTVAEKDLRREPLTDTDDCSDGSCSLDIENGQKLLLALPPTAKDGAVTNGRRVSPFCAVCLGRYVVGDAVVWSTNPECCHVFHEECIATWLMTKQNPLCPCCRQTFAEAKERPNTEPPSPPTAVVLADFLGGSMEEMEENEETGQQVPEQNEQSNEQNLQDRELREEWNNENSAHTQVDGDRDVESGTHTMDAENVGRPEASNDEIANSSELSI